jgi:hypothetical protein
MIQFKKTLVKLVPCRFFPEFLKEGVFLVSSGNNQIFRIKEKSDSYTLLEDQSEKTRRIDDIEKSNEMLLLFFVNGGIKYADPDVLFKINSEYVLAGPLDMMGDQIEEAFIVDANPLQIGNKIRKYGDYREWVSDYGLTAHQAYYWVDRIMVLDESKMREDGAPIRSYVREYTKQEFESEPGYPGWKEKFNPLDFSDIQKIISEGSVEIETEIIEIDGESPFEFEHPSAREGKCSVCLV